MFSTSEPSQPTNSPSDELKKELVHRAMLRQSIIYIRSRASSPIRARRLMCLTCTLLLVCSVGLLYFKYFHRGSVSDILAANSEGSGKSHDDYEYFESDDEEIAPKTMEESKRYWSNFVKKGKYVDIGNVWTSCNEKVPRMLIGKTVLTTKPDGGLLVKAFSNITLHKSLTDGSFKINATYNGKDLYSNKWDLCTFEKKSKHPVITCPLGKGHHKLYKENSVPGLLPKGNYITRICVTDQDDQDILYSVTKLKL